MNNDLIRRGELEGKAEMLISAARVMAGEDKVCQKAIDLMQQIVDLSKTLPAVDAVEVVRCEKCIHWSADCGTDETVCLKIYSDGAASAYAWQERKPDDFCSYGVRREDDA